MQVVYEVDHLIEPAHDSISAGTGLLTEKNVINRSLIVSIAFKITVHHSKFIKVSHHRQISHHSASFIHCLILPHPEVSKQ